MPPPETRRLTSPGTSQGRGGAGRGGHGSSAVSAPHSVQLWNRWYHWRASERRMRPSSR
ncbi:hypothetical protein ACFFX0_27865 [Citricoccus parietis]|uniref:Uncharacterized protein n=1 Tax=Citricoccus parietis TaxID=592307 RepID=A0ABV5G777_9MICC